MSSEGDHHIAGDINPSILAPSVEDTYTKLNPKLPHALIELKQHLTVWLLKARGEMAEMGHRDKWNQVQAARLAGRSRSTLKTAIRTGKLKTTNSGWITKAQLIEYLGFDPIKEKIDKIISFEKDILRLTEEIEQIILTGQN